MRRIVVAVLFLSTVGLVSLAPMPVALATDAMAGVKSFCAERWPGDFSMQNRCVDRQLKSSRKIQKYFRRHEIPRKARAFLDGHGKSGPYLTMANTCNKRWGKQNGRKADYFMIARCLERQEKAYKSLNPTGGPKRKRGPYGKPPGDRLEDKLSPFE